MPWQPSLLAPGHFEAPRGGRCPRLRGPQPSCPGVTEYLGHLGSLWLGSPRQGPYKMSPRQIRWEGESMGREENSRGDRVGGAVHNKRACLSTNPQKLGMGLGRQSPSS